MRVAHAVDGALLGDGEDGELTVTSRFMSDGYVQNGQLVRHGPFHRTGDAGRVIHEHGKCHVFVLRRLRKPIVVKHGTLSVTLQVSMCA